jgi:hypothetical protein
LSIWISLQAEFRYFLRWLRSHTGQLFVFSSYSGLSLSFEDSVQIAPIVGKFRQSCVEAETDKTKGERVDAMSGNFIKAD